MGQMTEADLILFNGKDVLQSNEENLDQSPSHSIITELKEFYIVIQQS